MRYDIFIITNLLHYLTCTKLLPLPILTIDNSCPYGVSLQKEYMAIYIHSNEIHNVAALIKCLLMLRCQPYMFRTVMVHPQELLCRYCMCRLWYVVRNALLDTFSWYSVVPARTIVCTYRIYKEAPEDGPLRSETCRADT